MPLVRKLTAILAVSLSAACAAAQTVDLSRDETVIAELQKVRGAENAEAAAANPALAKKLAAASKLDARSVCIERLKGAAGVVVIGFFRNDHGCHFAGGFVGPRFYDAEKGELTNLSAAALRALGWARAKNTQERERISLAWVENGVEAFSNVIRSPSERLPPSRFHPPRAETAPTGEVKVSVWVSVPGGRGREKAYRENRYVIDASGNMTISPAPTASADAN